MVSVFYKVSGYLGCHVWPFVNTTEANNSQKYIKEDSKVGGQK